MYRRNLLFLAAALAVIVGAVFYYLTFDSSSDADLANEPGLANGSRSDTSSIVRADRIEEKKSNYVPVEVNPEDYTTAPKSGTVEGRLLKVFADRQLPDPEKVERLLQMFYSLPPEGKKTALDYATQLISDDDYLRQRPRLLRMAENDDLREVVMLDMLTRDDGIKMPSLVELMKTPSETARNEAREILEAFLEKDYGADPNQWVAPVQQWVAENQDI